MDYHNLNNNTIDNNDKYSNGCPNSTKWNRNPHRYPYFFNYGSNQFVVKPPPVRIRTIPDWVFSPGLKSIGGIGDATVIAWNFKQDKVLW